MNEYDLNVLTDKNLGDGSFVREMLSSWRNDLDERLRPEFFDLGEPIRKSFEKEGLETAIRMWVDNGMALYLRRNSKPKYEVSIEWFEREQSLDERLFPWSCSVWLNHSAGDDLALILFRFLIRWFEPAFGHATTYKDHRLKHFITFDDGVGTTEQYVGLDITEKEEMLPGIYWTTYFGPWAIKKIAKTRFHMLDVEKIESVNNGYLVMAYGSSSEIGSTKALKIENDVIGKLGREHFFDISKIDIEALKASQEEVEEVEKVIDEVKAKRSSS